MLCTMDYSNRELSGIHSNTSSGEQVVPQMGLNPALTSPVKFGFETGG